MNIRNSGYIAVLMLGAAAFAAPASAQLKGIGGHPGGVSAPHVGGAGIAAHPSIGAGLGTSPGFGAGKLGSAPLITGRSVAAPNAGLAAAVGAPKAGFAAGPGLASNRPLRGAWAGGHHRRFWPYAAAAAGAGIAYGAGTYGYDYDYGYPYDAGYFDPGYDIAPVSPVATGIAEGGSCATPVLVCRLYEPAEIGLGCTCTVNGGPARGVVQP